MNLIINADDFGISKGVNHGIIDSHVHGVVSSTSMMITMPEVDHAIELSRKVPTLKIGLHLNMTFGKPLTNCKSLLKENGTFFKPIENPDQDKFLEEEIYLEFLAQYNLFVAKLGKKPTHFDSHLYAHQKYPKAKKAVIRLAEEMRVPVRDIDIKGFKPSKFLDFFKSRDNRNLLDVFEENLSYVLSFDTCEMMVHPGYIDDFLLEFSTYNLPRAEEIGVLTSEKIKDLINTHKINIVNYEYLRGN